MKRTITTIAIALALFSCTTKKAEPAATMEDIMKVHDRVMAADEKLTANKMQLDSFLKNADVAPGHPAAVLDKKLADAETAMENWMHNFDGELKGKSDAEKQAYFNDQMKQITAIDSQITVAVDESNKYLLKVKTK